MVWYSNVNQSPRYIQSYHVYGICNITARAIATKPLEGLVFFTALKTLFHLFIPTLLATADHFIVSVALPFPERHAVGSV